MVTIIVIRISSFSGNFIGCFLLGLIGESGIVLD
jgi:hypothetical protein